MAVKHTQILSALRNEIVSEAAAPDSQFPTHDQLLERFGASLATI